MRINAVICDKNAKRLKQAQVGREHAGFTKQDLAEAEDLARDWALAHNKRQLASHYANGNYTFWVEDK
jgi:hypothetical protein